LVPGELPAGGVGGLHMVGAVGQAAVAPVPRDHVLLALVLPLLHQERVELLEAREQRGVPWLHEALVHVVGQILVARGHQVEWPAGGGLLERLVIVGDVGVCDVARAVLVGVVLAGQQVVLLRLRAVRLVAWPLEYGQVVWLLADRRALAWLGTDRSAWRTA